jgi:hypothetical protein
MIRLACVALVLALGAPLLLPETTTSSAAPAGFVPVAADEWSQHVFFAVLEGLYVDGVGNEVVDAILVTDPDSGFPQNFVWACPICMPALDAFHLYRGRPDFQGLKSPRNTFGDGLSDEVLGDLQSPFLDIRQSAIRGLVERWVERRVASLRLDEDERARWDQALAERRKKGMAMLASYRDLERPGSYGAMKACPFCDGANDALVPEGRR